MRLPIVYHEDYSILWPEAHRFPMTKFEMLYEHLIAVGLAVPEQFHRPRSVSTGSLARVHEKCYLTSFLEGTWEEKTRRRIGMPWYPDLVRRVRAEVGGTVLTTRLALAHGLACNTAGGTHHAHRDFGSGFCILNDLAVAARLLLDRGEVEKILIVDLDVHQGDGTAAIFADEPRVFTFDIHGARNFPFRKQRCDREVGLPDGTGDGDYLAILSAHLDELLPLVRPDLVIYDAGVDVHRDDRLGRLALSTDGLYARDALVLNAARQRGIPIACVVGGGYDDARERLPARHEMLFRAAGACWDRETRSRS